MPTGARHCRWLIGPLAVCGCLRFGYDALGSDSGGSGGAGGGGQPGGGLSSGSAGEATGADGGTAGESAGGAAGDGAAGSSAAFAGSGGAPPILPGPPLAAFSISPPAGDPDTVFEVDASASADAEDPQTELTFEWDWESDGSFDAGGVTSTHSFGAVGDYTVTLRVTDTDGNSALASRPVTVVLAGDILVVTTGADETDDDGTLSLREAITLANAAAGKQVITFEAGLTIAPDYDLPALTDVTDIYAAGSAIDGSVQGGNGSCLRFRSTVRAYDLEIYGCGGPPITIQNATGCVVSGGFFHDNAYALYSLGSSNHRFENNEITRSARGGFYGNSAGDQVVGNRIHEIAEQAILTGGGADGIVITHNLLLGGTESIAIAGSDAIIWHNTMVGPSQSAVRPVNASGIDLRNNVIVGAGQYGISGGDGAFLFQDYNLFFDNGSGPCSACTPGANQLESDPRFLDAAAGDYRLSSDSPAIDAGIDVGLPFSGAAPDLGFDESEG